MPHKAAVVVDMLEHVHHQHEVAVGGANITPVLHRFVGNCVVAVDQIADVDTEGGLRIGVDQQMAREEAGARPDIEDAA